MARRAPDGPPKAKPGADAGKRRRRHRLDRLRPNSAVHRSPLMSWDRFVKNQVGLDNRSPLIVRSSFAAETAAEQPSAFQDEG
jgi:hypothetical protein